MCVWSKVILYKIILYIFKFYICVYQRAFIHEKEGDF